MVINATILSTLYFIPSTVEQVRASAVGIILSGSLEQPAPARSAGIAGSAKSTHRPAQRSHRAGSRETTGSAAAHDPSRRRSADGLGVRVDHRFSGAFSL